MEKINRHAREVMEVYGVQALDRNNDIIDRNALIAKEHYKVQHEAIGGFAKSRGFFTKTIKGEEWQFSVEDPTKLYWEYCAGEVSVNNMLADWRERKYVRLAITGKELLDPNYPGYYAWRDAQKINKNSEVVSTIVVDAHYIENKKPTAADILRSKENYTPMPNSDNFDIHAYNEYRKTNPVPPKIQAIYDRLKEQEIENRLPGVYKDRGTDEKIRFVAGCDCGCGTGHGLFRRD